MMVIKEVFLRWFTIFLKKTSSVTCVLSEIISNQQLAEELNKTIINKFEKRKSYSSFRDNI